MSKIAIILLVATSLTGCYQTINQYDLSDAARICGSIENIASISANFAGNEAVTCMNNTTKYLHRGEYE